MKVVVDSAKPDDTLFPGAKRQKILSPTKYLSLPFTRVILPFKLLEPRPHTSLSLLLLGLCAAGLFFHQQDFIEFPCVKHEPKEHTEHRV